MKVGDKVQLRRRISQKGGKTRLGKGHDPWNLSASYTGQKPERDCEELYKLGVAAVDQQRRNGRRRIMAQEGVNND